MIVYSEVKQRPLVTVLRCQKCGRSTWIANGDAIFLCCWADEARGREGWLAPILEHHTPACLRSRDEGKHVQECDCPCHQD